MQNLLHHQIITTYSYYHKHNTMHSPKTTGPYFSKPSRLSHPSILIIVFDRNKTPWTLMRSMNLVFWMRKFEYLIPFRSSLTQCLTEMKWIQCFNKKIIKFQIFIFQFTIFQKKTNICNPVPWFCDDKPFDFLQSSSKHRCPSNGRKGGAPFKCKIQKSFQSIPSGKADMKCSALVIFCNVILCITSVMYCNTHVL